VTAYCSLCTWNHWLHNTKTYGIQRDLLMFSSCFISGSTDDRPRGCFGDRKSRVTRYLMTSRIHFNREATKTRRDHWCASVVMAMIKGTFFVPPVAFRLNYNLSTPVWSSFLIFAQFFSVRMLQENLSVTPPDEGDCTKGAYHAFWMMFVNVSMLIHCLIWLWNISNKTLLNILRQHQPTLTICCFDWNSGSLKSLQL